MRPAQVEDVVAGLDDGAVDQPGHDRPDLAGRDRGHHLVDQRDARPPGRRARISDCPCPWRASAIESRSAKRSPIAPACSKIAYAAAAPPPNSVANAVGSSRSPRSAQSSSPSSTSRCARATHPPARAVSPRIVQAQCRARTRTGRPWRGRRCAGARWWARSRVGGAVVVPAGEVGSQSRAARGRRRRAATARRPRSARRTRWPTPPARRRRVPGRAQWSSPSPPSPGGSAHWPAASRSPR